MTISPDMRQNAREAKAYDKASSVAVAVAEIMGGIAFLAWAYVIFQAGDQAQESPVAGAATLVVATMATAFCAAFGAAWFVLDALHRAHTGE